MGVNGLYLGLNPAVGYIASQVRAATPWGVDTQLIDPNPGETLAQVAERMGVEVDHLVNTNTIELRSQLGADVVSGLQRGTLEPNEIVLSGEEVLSYPDSSVVGTLLDDVFFTFGTEDSPAGALYSIAPSWFGYAMRGFGIWQSSGDPKAWAQLDSDGKVVLPDAFPTFLEVLSNPMERMQIVGEINTQLLHLESSEKLISRWKEQVGLLEKVTQDAVASGWSVVGEGENATLEGVGDAALAEAWNEQKLMLQEWNASIIKRAVDNAGGALIVRGMTGAVSPGTPSMLFNEQRQVEAYWEAVKMDEQAAGRGSENFRRRLPTTLESFESRQSLVKEFLDDPSGDSAKAWFHRNYPEIAVFTTPKTFWGPNGAPIPYESFEEYGELVRQGLRQPSPPGVTMQRALRAMIYADREVAVQGLVAAETATQEAANIVNNFGAYQDIKEEGNVRLAALDWWDSQMNGGEYLEWRQRNADDTLTLAEETAKRATELTDALGLLEEFAPAQDMDDKERRTYTAQLKAAASGSRALASEFLEQLNNSQYESPRDAEIAWYFETVVAGYYDGLSDLYEKIDATPDKEAQSAIFEEIRQYETREFASVRERNGVQFPNALEYSWNRKDDEGKQNRLMRWVALQPEWLGLQATSRIVEQSPSAAGYLPTKPHDFNVYKQYNNELIWLKEQAEAGTAGDGTRAMSESDRRKYKTGLDEWLRQSLASEGRLKELEFRDMYPIERMKITGLLPYQFEKYLPNVTYARSYLASIDKGPRSKEGTYLFDQIVLQVRADMQADPGLQTQLLEMTDVMWDIQTVDEALERLLFNGF